MSHWALGRCGIFSFRGRRFVLEGKENISGKPFCSKQNGLIYESLASNHSPPRASPELAFLVAQMPGETFILVGERKISSFLWGIEINGESLREALLSTSRMKESLLFEQASGKSQL